MPKKAYIVEFSVATRVVVDVPKDMADSSPSRNDELFGLIAQAACEKVSQLPHDYIRFENVVSCKEDNA